MSKGKITKASIWAKKWLKKENIYPPGTIGIPVYRSLTHEFLDTIDGLEVPEGTIVARKEGSYVGRNREHLAEEMHGEWIMFVDSDEVFPSGMIMRLLSHNLPIVSATYYKRGDDFCPQIWKFSHVDEKDQNQNHYTPMTGAVGDYLKRHRDELARGTETRIAMMLNEPELIECDAVGGGALLVRKSALMQMKQPYFGIKASEDFAFCENAKASGLKIYADLSIQVGHLYTIAVGYPHFLARNGYVTF